jgi:hypothetical protein
MSLCTSFKATSIHLKACLLTLAGLISACVPVADKHLNDVATNMSTCEVVNAIVRGHANGFEKLRGNRTYTPYGDIWKARYDVVGSGCEIWQSGRGDTHYVCTLSAPDKATADGYYNAARDALRSCLGTTWQETEQPRKLAVGVKSTFNKPDEKAVIAIHEIQNDGLLKQQWTVYYIVGEPNDSL